MRAALSRMLSSHFCPRPAKSGAHGYAEQTALDTKRLNNVHLTVIVWRIPLPFDVGGV